MIKHVIVVAAALALLAGCASSGGTSAPSGDAGGASTTPKAASGAIVVDAAASLTEAFTTLKSQFEKAHPGASVTLNFGASSDLSTQITQGQPVDVFASASPKNMDTVVKAGLATDPQTFVTNTAEIAVPPSNPGKVSALADLAKKGVKVALCAPAVPCGALAAKVFANAKITVKPVASEKDVKSTLAVVESGEVDAGVVYVTDVRAAGNKVKGITIPDGTNASTAYPIAALKKSKNPSLATAWVDLVTSDAGRKVLTADGFSSP